MPALPSLPRSRALRIALAICLAGLVGAGAFIAAPLPAHLLDRKSVTSVRFTDRDGGLLRELRSRDDGRSVPLASGNLPPLVRDAFLAAEDARFFSHPGIDVRAIARAAWQDLRAFRIVSGASTLTQQLARELVPHERSLSGKLLEALWALRLTAHLPRERILLEHLDRVPLGNSTYGVEAASELYFARPAASLSAGQAALLAGMAQSPARYDPFRHPDKARVRKEEVLGRMEKLGLLSSEDARVARNGPIDLVPPSRAFRAPHLVAHLVHELAAQGLDDAARIETTLEPALQRDVENILREELAGLANRRVTQAAAIVIDNASGEVLAWVGSANFLDEPHGGQNDGVRSPRQPGSALKPFAYGLALARGYTPSTVLSDVETHLAIPAGEYTPHNYDKRIHGPVRLRAALANSYNVPAVRLAEALGPDRVLEVLHRAGFESLKEDASHYGVGMVLGDGDVTLRELARGYYGLARGGVSGPLTEIRAAFDAAGRSIAIRRELKPQRFLPASAVSLLTDVLSDESARIPAFGLDNALRLPFPVAAKTGTSRAYIDNWTAGFTHERTVAVWVGNFDGQPMQNVSGISGAGPIFRRVMIRAMRGLHPEPLVDRSRFEEADICPLSGERAGASCPGVLHEVFQRGTAPRTSCAMHSGGGGRALSLPTTYEKWARTERIPASLSGAAPGLLSPVDGDEFLLEPGVPLEAQSISVRALPPDGVAALELRTDDGRTMSMTSPFVAHVPAKVGERRVELWVPGGSRPIAVSRFVVR